MSLSERIRPNCEAAPWVIEEVKQLELELAEVYAELRKLSGNVRGIFDRTVWERAKNANPNAALRGAEPDLSAERPLEGTVMPHVVGD